MTRVQNILHQNKVSPKLAAPKLSVLKYFIIKNLFYQNNKELTGYEYQSGAFQTIILFLFIQVLLLIWHNYKGVPDMTVTMQKYYITKWKDIKFINNNINKQFIYINEYK